MKQISEALATRLSGEALTLCLCWRLSRRDGVVIGFTDHDQVLTVQDMTYQPGGACEAGAFVQSDSLKPGMAAGEGVVSSDAILEADLRNGLWDGCRVQVYQADWASPESGQRHVWSGYLSELTLTETGQYAAELVSLKSDLERPLGRVLQKRCDAELGDARCGVEALGRTCDQRFETCRDVFANSENYRGFPHMPGNDFILAGPAATNNDGGQR
ncbi:MAG: DUF2163 domain-containing protein [Henriciella sp.]|nr:DUF2163 domain-containing protein [Henriciella sp.]